MPWAAADNTMTFPSSRQMMTQALILLEMVMLWMNKNNIITIITVKNRSQYSEADVVVVKYTKYSEVEACPK